MQRRVPQMPSAGAQLREQMRELCDRADGVAASDVVGLCHQTWG
ncbi:MULTISPECIES: hypothetical protein [Streptomyces]|nr:MULTISPECIES: hypothetical protein [Streptomyces]